MTIAGSLAPIALGAILRYAVTAGVDLYIADRGGWRRGRSA
jgi:hypothetical protein